MITKLRYADDIILLATSEAEQLEMVDCQTESAANTAYSFKVASITPVLKKQGLNPAVASSYRPV